MVADQGQVMPLQQVQQGAGGSGTYLGGVDVNRDNYAIRQFPAVYARHITQLLMSRRSMQLLCPHAPCRPDEGKVAIMKESLQQHKRVTSTHYRRLGNLAITQNMTVTIVGTSAIRFPRCRCSLEKLLAPLASVKISGILDATG